MLERDYIKRLIRQFFDAIEKLKEDKKEADLPTLQLQVDSMYRAYFQQPSSFFSAQSAEADISYLASAFPPEEVSERADMLSELYYQDALLKQGDGRKELLQKSLELLTYVDKHSDTFSFKRRAKMVNLQSLISK